jgi:hypothetical protein
MTTRDAFNHQLDAAKAVERREGRLLALVSVSLGIAQLIFLRWGEAHLARNLAIGSSGGVCVAYLVLIGALVWRMDRRVNAKRPTCPQCGAVLKGMSERVAVATGNCDHCGGRILEQETR